MEPPSYGRTNMLWDSLLVMMKSGCAEGRGFAPRPGQYSKESLFHPTRKLVRFSLLKCPYIPNFKFGIT